MDYFSEMKLMEKKIQKKYKKKISKDFKGHHKIFLNEMIIKKQEYH